MITYAYIFCVAGLGLALALMMWGFVIGPLSTIKDKDLKVSKHGV